MHQFDNQHAERAAAATILQNPDFLTEMDGRLDLEAFKNPANRAIIQLALDLYNGGYTKFDKELLRNRIVLVPVPGIENYQMQNYVEALLTADVESVNFGNYLEELRSSHLKDSLHKTLNRLIGEVANAKPTQASTLLGKLQTELYDLDSGINRNDEPVDIGKTIKETIYGLVDKPLVGIPTGIDLLDDMTLGWIPKKFYFIGARPGEGKSAFLLQCTAHAAFFAKAKRVPVLYLDTEIDDKEFKIRLTGHLAGVDTKIIQQGLWLKDPRMKENVDKALFFVHKIGGVYHKEMPGYSLSNVVNTIRKYVYSHGVGLVIFDYIEEPTDEGGDKARWEKVGLVARTLKKYAQILEIPIVAALQQNREGADKSRVSARMYAESDDVFKKADGAMALNRKSGEEIKKETIAAGTHRLQILKGRYHGTSYNGLNLSYIGYCLRFWPSRLQAMEQQEENHDGEVNNEQQIPVAAEHPTGSLVP